MFFNRQSKEEKLIIEQNINKNLNSQLRRLVKSHQQNLELLFNASNVFNYSILKFFSNGTKHKNFSDFHGNTLELYNKYRRAIKMNKPRIIKEAEDRKAREMNLKLGVLESVRLAERNLAIQRMENIPQIDILNSEFHSFCNRNHSFFENFVLYISDFFENELSDLINFSERLYHLYYTKNDIETLLIDNREMTKQVDFFSTYLNKLNKLMESYEEIKLLEKREREKEREISQERINKEKQKLELEKKEQELVLQKKRQQEEILKKLKLEKTIQEEENNSRKQRKDDIMFILNRNFLVKQSIDNNNYYTIAHYFPVSLYPNVPSNISKHRTELWNIRENGNVDYFLDYFFKGNLIDFNVHTEDIIVSIIPSKTNYLSEIVLKKLCISISEKWKIQNGFSFIKVSNEREIIKDRESDELLNIDFNTDVFKGKTVFLLSDMFHSRDMFLKYVNRLKDYEAKDVIGVFLAERYDAEIHGLPDWD